MRHRVLHHAHHPDEGEAGIYRLVFARVEEVVEHVEVPNPAHDPEAEVPEPETITAQRTRDAHFDPQEIVWAADDERWSGLEPQEIAEQQRRDVAEALARRADLLERAQATHAQRRVVDLGAGVEL